MARKAEKLDPVDKILLEEVGADIVQALDGMFFAAEGTPTATVKFEDGVYKKKPIIPGLEFALTNVYVGARGTPILVFDPEDAQEYAHMEADLKQADNFLPMLAPAIATQFEMSDIPDESLKAVFDTLVIRKVQQVEEASKKKEEEARETYREHPDFGRF